MSVPELVPDPTPSEPTAPSISGQEPSPFAKVGTPKPGENPQAQEPNRPLVIALVILLTITLLALFSQMRTTAALETQVSALRADVAKAQAVVASYQGRFERVRDEVGELVTRIGALSSLVAPPVLPEGDSVAPTEEEDADAELQNSLPPAAE